jgi:hypothetical protein
MQSTWASPSAEPWDDAAAANRLSWGSWTNAFSYRRSIPPSRQSTMFSSSTDMSTESVKRVKRISAVSTFYAKQVTVIMRKLTIGSSSDLPNSSSVAVHNTAQLVTEPFNISEEDGLVLLPPPAIAVPGDFILADKYQSICQEKGHPFGRKQ